jgi:hypothetical protein
MCEKPIHLKNKGRECKAGPVWGWVPVEGEDEQRGWRRGNIILQWELLTLFEEGGVRESDGRGECNQGTL